MCVQAGLLKISCAPAAICSDSCVISMEYPVTQYTYTYAVHFPEPTTLLLRLRRLLPANFYLMDCLRLHRASGACYRSLIPEDYRTTDYSCKDCIPVSSYYWSEPTMSTTTTCDNSNGLSLSLSRRIASS